MNRLINELKNRILVLDGAMGTSIQSYGLSEQDFRNPQLASKQKQLKGNNDLLTLTRPDVIKEIHMNFLSAGSDIIETNTFSANAISQADYDCQEFVYELNKRSAEIAREAIQEFLKSLGSDVVKEETKDEMDKNVKQFSKQELANNKITTPRFVAGSIGPTTKVASISPNVNDSAYRDTTFDQLEEVYSEQIRGLMDGGVDFLLIETVIDALNGRAALYAAEKVFEEKGRKLPIFVSGTITDKSGRLLSGQTIEAFALSMKSPDVIGIGMNCSFGVKELIPFIKRLSKIQDLFISIYPNAGFRDVMGNFDEQPLTTAGLLTELVDGGYLNLVGGCCGTTPEHIKEISKIVKNKKPRELFSIEPKTVVCGLEPLTIDKENNFVNIGERTNVSGSKKFARLIAEKKYEEAINVAREQVENGAQIIDINLDDAMLDAEKEMEIFLRMIGSEPEVSKVPIMIDSSDFKVIRAGLKAIQGKHIVNSISMKEGKEDFVKKAKEVKQFGAAVVVMAFDEKGQADTFERKIEVCKKAYDILTKEVGFLPTDIIFDPNILAIATGLEEHRNYAVDYINAVKWIKENLPHAKVSGGVSNLSFSFRGNNYVREMMHSVFLYHAIEAGLDMGIVNPSMLMVYEDIPKDVLEIVEDVVLNRKEGSEEALLLYAQGVKSQDPAMQEKKKEWRNLSVEGRLSHAIVDGLTEFVDEDVAEAIENYEDALSIVEGPLMDGMNKVGELFGDGKMFLPQVIKSARVMKKAVEILVPHIEKQNANLSSTKSGRILLATVKGDVHDIGKNIVGVVLGCNNYEVIDLGIMVPPEEILSKAKELKPDILGLSGLITPSLEEMAIVAEMLEKEGFDIPVMVGGATTSKIHTAIKIQPKYKSGLIHVKDASKSVEVCKKLVNPELKKVFLKEIDEEYQQIRDNYFAVEKKHVSIEEARKNGLKLEINVGMSANSKPDIKVPNMYELDFAEDKYQKGKIETSLVTTNFPIAEIRKYIDWTFFFIAFGMQMTYPKILKDEKYGVEASKLLADANALLDEIEKNNLLELNAAFGIFPANSDGDDIVVYDGLEARGNENTAATNEVGDNRQGKDERKGSCCCGSKSNHSCGGCCKKTVSVSDKKIDNLNQSEELAKDLNNDLVEEKDNFNSQKEKHLSESFNELEHEKQYKSVSLVTNSSTEHVKKEFLRFNMMRRQDVIKDEKHVSLADFIAPVENGVTDFIGAFAVTAGLGAQELSDKYESEGDSYRAILVKIIADRLAEAMAERLHELVRKEYWGYAQDEKLSLEQILKGDYTGIRPAIGYPSIPDHSEKLKLQKLLEFDRIGINLTDSFMMEPVASVCGFYFAHPKAKYFDIGRVYKDQLEDYAKRKGTDTEAIRKIMPNRAV